MSAVCPQSPCPQSPCSRRLLPRGAWPSAQHQVQPGPARSPSPARGRHWGRGGGKGWLRPRPRRRAACRSLPRGFSPGSHGGQRWGRLAHGPAGLRGGGQPLGHALCSAAKGDPHVRLTSAIPGTTRAVALPVVPSCHLARENTQTRPPGGPGARLRGVRSLAPASGRFCKRRDSQAPPGGRGFTCPGGPAGRGRPSWGPGDRPQGREGLLLCRREGGSVVPGPSPLPPSAVVATPRWTSPGLHSQPCQAPAGGGLALLLAALSRLRPRGQNRTWL